jgi:hypothetical protein
MLSKLERLGIVLDGAERVLFPDSTYRTCTTPVQGRISPVPFYKSENDAKNT